MFVFIILSWACIYFIDEQARSLTELFRERCYELDAFALLIARLCCLPTEFFLSSYYSLVRLFSKPRAALRVAYAFIGNLFSAVDVLEPDSDFW